MKLKILAAALLLPPLAAPAQTINAKVVQSLVGQPVARVNGTVLTQRDLLREMYSIFPYARTHNGFPKSMEADIRKGALKMIEFEELVYQDALRRKLTVPAAQMNRAMADYRSQFSSEQEYRSYLANEMSGSEEKLRVEVKRSILIEQMLKTQINDRAAVSMAEAKAYYDKNPDRFRVPDSFIFQSISVLPPDKATPEQLKEVAKRAADALRQAKATKNYTDFGLLAEKISEDDFRVNMGLHKEVDRAKLPPAMANALQNLQPDQMSGLIQVDNAFTILRLKSHRSAGIKSFDEVKDDLRTNLEKQKNEQLRQALDKRLRMTAKVEEL